MSDSVLPLLDELRTIAQNGLRYADDPYDEVRYERILDLVSEQYGEIAGLPAEEVSGRFKERVGHVTPNVGGRAAVVDDEDRVLVVQRAGDGSWCLPAGFSDPGETPAETAVRETKEETGLDVEAVDLLDVYARDADAANPHGFVGLAYHCEVVGGERATSHETEDVRFRAVDDVDDWHKDHGEVARDAVAACRDETGGTGC